MKKFLLLLALAAAGAACALTLNVAPAAAWSPTNLPAGWSVSHGTDVSPTANCPEWYRITAVDAAGHSLAVSDPLCTNSPTYQADFDAFVDAHYTPPPAATTAPATTAPATTTTPTTTDPPTTTAPPPTTTDTTTTTPPPAPAPVTTTVAAALPAPPAADFAVTPEPNAYVIDFTDTSTSSSALSSRVWLFGDGTASTGAAPVHAFAGPGSYAVVLAIVDAAGLSSLAVHQLTILADHSITFGPRTTAVVSKPTVTKPVAKKAPARKHVVAKKHAKKKRPPKH